MVSQPQCRILAGISDDELLRREVVHRASGEVAAIMASLEIGLAARTRAGLRKAVALSYARLRAAEQCLALLSDVEPNGVVWADEQIERLARAICSGHAFAHKVACAIDLVPVNLPAPLAQRLSLIAAELISNAVRHGLANGGSTLRIRLRERRQGVLFVVFDDGHGFTKARPFGASQGIRIAAELAHRAGGRLSCTSEDNGSSVCVELPIKPTELQAAKIVSS